MEYYFPKIILSQNKITLFSWLDLELHLILAMMVLLRLTQKEKYNFGDSDGKTDYNTDNWEDIVQIAAASDNVIGLKKDGTVVVTGSNSWGQKEAEKWTDIIAVKAFGSSVYGIKKDGTILEAGFCLHGGPLNGFDYDLGDLKLW